MTQAILIRVDAENYNHWRTAHDSCREARLDYGMTDGPVYRDEKNLETVLVQLNVEDMERARGWFRDERFKAAVERAGNVSRQVWFASLNQ